MFHHVFCSLYLTQQKKQQSLGFHSLFLPGQVKTFADDILLCQPSVSIIAVQQTLCSFVPSLRSDRAVCRRHVYFTEGSISAVWQHEKEKVPTNVIDA